LYYQISQPSGERETTGEEEGSEISRRECYIESTASISQYCCFVCEPIVLDA
jgi:hypothetical protein